MPSAGEAPEILLQLREATRSRHSALDAALRLTTRDAYARFVQSTLALLAPVEPLLADIVPGVVRVERTPVLHDDLAELGLDALAPRPWRYPLASEHEALGAAYVLEGSTLGGVVLADRVESALGLGATRYLRLRGRATGSRWREFLGELARRDASQTGQARAACCRAACAMFDHYAAAYGDAGLLA